MPHLRDLGRLPHDSTSMPKRRRLTQKREDPGAGPRSYEAAWSWYVRGNIVSRHAQRIITQFLAASCSKSTSEDPRQQEEAQVLAENLHVMNSDVSLTRVHNVLSQIVARAHASEKAAADGEANADERLLKFSAQIQTAVRVGSELWGMEKMQWPETALDCRGSMLLRTESATLKRRVSAPMVSARKVKHAYINLRTADVEGWFMRLQTERCCEIDDCVCEVKRKPPNADQLHFLRSVAKRCEEEAADLSRPGAKYGSEPMRCGLFGLPGAGKTECSKLQKRFFEECLGWEAGIQYQCVAPQNTMAALLGGSTCHTWGQVPINPTDALATRSSKKNLWRY